MAERTVGVEEELLLVDAVHANPAPVGDDVVRTAVERLRPGDLADGTPPLEHEFKKQQAEIGSAPSNTADELFVSLREQRRLASAAAATAGAQIAALATSPLKVRPTATEDERYERMTREFGLLARQQLTCGQHVHVSIDTREQGVGVLDRIAPWLSILVALSASSPYWQGQDTG